MDEKKIKKYIAKEGLVFLTIVSLGITLTLSPLVYVNIIYLLRTTLYPFKIFPPTPPIFYDLRLLGHLILFFGYPLYLVIRFIKWAIPTLREK